MHHGAMSHWKKDSDLDKAHNKYRDVYGHGLYLAVDADGYCEQRQRRRVGRPHDDGRSEDNGDDGDRYCARRKVGPTPDRR